ncbi:MAG: hypothetical protein KC733_05555 [Candidatus Omnitrophica bacterium]|nr:hypothetical protein [Candidatus Omnitrophota bacterium]
MKKSLKQIGLIVCIMVLTLTINVSESLALKATSVEMESLNTADVDIDKAEVRYLSELDLLVFEIQVDGLAGQTTPEARGQMDGAPVLGYVFPTTLKSEDVGFNPTEGIVALAVTSHPDFDDTALWDENNDRDYDNDGIIFHSHWVVLRKDERVTGGLSVKQFNKDDSSIVLPPTNPGMPMYMDSPGFSIVLKGNKLKVLVPAQRINHKKSFNFDAVTAYMEVDPAENTPLLGVYKVYDVLSGDLSLPYNVK